jgi:hypothetical protein
MQLDLAIVDAYPHAFSTPRGAEPHVRRIESGSGFRRFAKRIEITLHRLK